MAAGFVEGDKVDAGVLVAPLRFQDAVNHRQAGFLRIHSLPHEFHDHEGRTIPHDILADPGGTGGTHLVVDVESPPDDGRITNSPRVFAAQSTRRAAARDVAVAPEDEQGDGVVIVR